MEKPLVHLKGLEVLRVIDEASRASGVPYFLAYGTLLGAVRDKGYIPWDKDADVWIPSSGLDALKAELINRLPSNCEIRDQREQPTEGTLLPGIVYRKPDGTTEPLVDLFLLAGSPASELGRRLFSWFTYGIAMSYTAKQMGRYVPFPDSPRKSTAFKMMQVLLAPVPSSTLAAIHRMSERMIPIGRSNFVRSLGSNPKQWNTFPTGWLRKPVRMVFEGENFVGFANAHEFLVRNYGDYMVPRETNYFASRWISIGNDERS